MQVLSLIIAERVFYDGVRSRVDIRGGLYRLRCPQIPYIKDSFWVFAEVLEVKAGQKYSFKIERPDRSHYPCGDVQRDAPRRGEITSFGVRVDNFDFDAEGTYFAVVTCEGSALARRPLLVEATEHDEPFDDLSDGGIASFGEDPDDESGLRDPDDEDEFLNRREFGP
jgi:hypothetical protein